MKPSGILVIATLLLASVSRAEEVAPQEDGPVIATVGDTKITESEKEDLAETVLQILLERYAVDHQIAASEEEIAKFTRRLAEVETEELARDGKRKSDLAAELQSDQLDEDGRANKTAELAGIEERLKSAAASGDGLTEAEKKEVAEVRKTMAGAVIKAWKVNKSLFEKHGGRVIFQQMGPEPLDAYRKLLEEQLRAGTLKLSDKKYEADLWWIYTDDKRHDFVPEAKCSELINMPPWERKEEVE